MSTNGTCGEHCTSTSHHAYGPCREPAGHNTSPHRDACGHCWTTTSTRDHTELTQHLAQVRGKLAVLADLWTDIAIRLERASDQWTDLCMARTMRGCAHDVTRLLEETR